LSKHELLIPIKSDTKNYVDGIKKVKSENDKLEKSMKSMLSLQKFTAAVTGFRMVKGAVGSVFNSIKQFISLHEKQIQAENKLKALMKNRADYTRKMYISHLAFARRLQKVTNFGDEEILQSISQFQTFGNISQKTAQEATKYAADIAQTTGQSITSVSIQLGKALSAPLKMASSLRRSGIMFDETKLKALNTETERQAYLLEEIRKQYAGAAAGSASPLKQFQNTIGDIKEEIGRGLMPAFLGMAKIIKSFMEGLSSVVKWFSDTFSSTTDVTNAFKELQIQLAESNKELEKLDNTDRLINRFEQLSEKTNKTKKEQKELETVTQSIAKAIPEASKGWDKYGNSIGIVAKEARKATKNMRNIQNDLISSQLNNTLQQFQKAQRNFAALRSAQKSGISGDFSSANIVGMSLDVSGAGRTVEARRKVVDEYRKQKAMLEKLEPAFFKINKVSEKQIGIMARLKLGINATSEAIREMKIQLEDQHYAYQELSKQYPKFAELTAKAQKQAYQYLRKSGYNMGGFEKLVNKLLKEQNKMNKISTGGGSGKSKFWSNLFKYAEMLEKLNRTKLRIELDKQANDFFEKLRIDKSDRIMLKVALDYGDSAEAIQKLMSKIPSDVLKKLTERGVNVEQMLQNYVKKYQDTINKNFTENNAIVNSFINGADELAKKIKEIDAERLKAEKALEKLRNQTASSLTDDEFEQRKKLIKKEAEYRKREASLQQAQNTVGKFGTFASGFQQFGAGIQRGGGAGVFQSMGGLSSSLSVVGGQFGKIAGTIGKSFGALGGLIDGFSSLFNNSEEAQKKEIARQNLLNKQLENQIYLETKLNRVIEDRMKNLQLIQTLYDGEIEQAKTLEYYQKNIADFEAKYGVFSNDELIAEQNKLMEQRNIISDAINEAGLAMAKWDADQLREAQNMMEKLYNDLQNLGYTWEDVTRALGGDLNSFYSINLGSLYSSILRQSEAQTAEINAQLSMIDTYAEALVGINQIEEDRLDIMKQQLKISDELYNKIRALGNENINKILDKAQELEKNIKLGIVREGSAEAERQRTLYMNQLMNLLGGIGESGLSSQVELARAEYYNSSNPQEFLAKAGLGDVVQLARGGYITQSGLASVHAGETIINKNMMNDFMKKLGGKNINLGGVNINIEGSNLSTADAQRLSNTVLDNIQRELRRANIRWN